MKTFLSKIAQLDSICDVTLLSSRGEPLFTFQKNSGDAAEGRTAAAWPEIIAGLGNPATADLLFAEGRYYLQKTAIGYLIVGMLDDSPLNKVRLACSTVSGKLSDTVLRKQTLLKLLTDVDDQLKPHVIKELMPLADRDMVRVLLGLLKQHGQFQPRARERLLLCICQALGYCSAPEAIAPLQAFAAAESGRISPYLATAIRIAVQQLEQQARQAPPAVPVTPQPSPAPPRQKKAEELKTRPAPQLPQAPPSVPEAQQIREFLQNNRKKEALDLILATITTRARNRDFGNAEKLRNWLMEIDAMAVTEIIRAAEIIEEERKAAISKEHLQTWQKLVEAISAEAFSALYHAFARQSYEAGAMIVDQGDLQPTLFFINSGKVQVLLNCDGRTEPVATLEAGNVFGVDTCFEMSVWTFSVKSLGTELFQLSHATFVKIAEQYPALESKLLAFAGRPVLSKAFFHRTRKTRRRHERKAATNRVAIVLLDDTGNETDKGAKR